jgi:glycosyltransferase involved in cell wall biosynthesis
VVPAASAAAIADALHSLILNTEERFEFGQAARQRVVREFSIDALADRCIEIYTTELAAKGN